MLARLHSLLGVVPLGAYLLFHLYDNWPALAGRELWVDQHLHSASGLWLAGLVLLALAVHAVLGGLRVLRTSPSDAALGASGSLRTLQAVTGALVLGFVLYHLTQVWGVDDGGGRDPRAIYAVLWRSLGRRLDVAIYLVGLSAICFHFAHGLSRAAVSFGLARSHRALLFVRAGAGVLGFALWAMWLQLLAHFALGTGLVG